MDGNGRPHSCQLAVDADNTANKLHKAIALKESNIICDRVTGFPLCSEINGKKVQRQREDAMRQQKKKQSTTCLLQRTTIRANAVILPQIPPH